jgi:hypothetical protein
MEGRKLRMYGNAIALIGILIAIIAISNRQYYDYGTFFQELRYLGSSYWDFDSSMILLQLIGIILTIIGIIIFLVGIGMDKKSTAVSTTTSAPPPPAPAPTTVPPPPAPPEQPTYPCKHCSNPLSYVYQYQKWYCYSCNKYAEASEKKED